MPLRLLLGRNKESKTDFYINEIAGLSEPAIVIVPEQFSFTAEKNLTHKTGVHGLGGAEILSFKRLAHKVLSSLSGASLPRLDSCSKILLILKILSDRQKDLTLFADWQTQKGIASEISSLFSEFRRYNISSDALSETEQNVSGSLKQKLHDLCIIYKDYEKLITQNFSDSDDDVTRLSAVIGQYVSGKEIYIDRFDSFTPAEILCIQNMLFSAKRVSLCLAMDKEDKQRPEFLPPSETARRIISFADDSHIPMEESLCFKEAQGTKTLSFLKKEYFNYPAATSDKAPEDIHIFAAQNPFSEIHNVANEIVNLCRDKGYMQRDIAIVSGNMANYEKYIKIIFPQYNISYFLDKRINILNHPVTVFVLSALEIIARGYTRDAIFRFVKTGFLRIPASDIDILENYVLATGVRGSIWKDDTKWSVRAAMYADKQEPDDNEKEEIDIADRARRKIIAPLLNLEKNLKEGKTALEKCRAVYAFTEELKIKRRILAMARLLEKSGDLAAAEEYKSIFNRLMEALDGVVTAFGDDSIGIGRFYDILKTGVAEYDTAIVPATLDGVSVGEAGRIRGYDIKALFIIGANDGVFPPLPDDNGILCEGDRIALSELGLETAPSIKHKCMETQHLIYKTLSMPEDEIYVSYSCADFDGGALRPSQLPGRIKEIFPNLSVQDDITQKLDIHKINSPEVAFKRLIEEMSAKNSSVSDVYGFFAKQDDFAKRLQNALDAMNYRNTASSLSTDTAKKLFGNGLYMSVSRLERFAACPFSYFIGYTLGAKERRILKLEARDAGNFLHNFIDEFSRRLVINEKSWREVDDDYINRETAIIMEDLQKHINSYAMENSKRCYYLFERLIDVVKRSVKNISDHIKRGEFEPVGYEMTFGDKGDFKPLKIDLPNGGQVTLTGRIDRVDMLHHPEGSFVRVIDYKSGSKEFHLDDVFYGLNLQLGVYMTAICDGSDNTKPAAMLYYRLADPLIDVKDPANEDELTKNRRKKMKLDGLILSNPEIIDSMDKGLKGASDFLPVRINKDGGTNGVTTEQFTTLSRHIKRRVRELSSALYSGNTQISPYSKNKKTPCDYCSFLSVCGFDLKTPGCNYRKIGISDNQDLWNRMRGEELGN